MNSKADTKTINQEKKCELKPKLRFPEFWDVGEWEDTSFCDLLEEIIDFRGRTPLKLGMEWGGGSIISLSANNVKNGYIDYDAECNLGSQALYEKWMGKVSLEKNDVVFTMEAPLGNAVLIPDTNKYILSQRVVVFKTKKEVNNFFLIQLIWGDQFQSSIDQLSTGSTAKGINQKSLKKVFIKIPSSSEQQKIADCLSSIDDRITAETQKLGTLKVHKKGLMQQLFPAEGETVPDRRFPEFRDAEEWQEMRLDDIATIRAGTTPSRATPEFYVNGSIPWVKTMDLNNSYIYHTEEKVTPLAKVKLNLEGSILVAMYGGFNQIGRTGYLKITAATNQAISVLNADKSRTTSLYLLIWLNAKIDVWKRFAVSSRKDANITGSDVAAFPITLPSLSEQQKIADCLSSLDELITAQTQKIDTLKIHKKGLMQQLFPAVEDAIE